MLGLQLVDANVVNIPLLATDPYGKFIPGPRGLPQYVTSSGLVEGNIGRARRRCRPTRSSPTRRS